MPFNQSQDTEVIKAELDKLAMISEHAINGMMSPKDFQDLEDLFAGVKKEQYNRYIQELSPQLSDENLHQLVAGLTVQSTSQGGANTFLRNNTITKGLLLEEARRHGLQVTYPPLTIPPVIPAAILDHYQTLLANPDCVRVFNGSRGEDYAEMRHKNLSNNIKFNILNTLVIEATESASLEIQQRIGSKLHTNNLVEAAALYGDIAKKITIEDNAIQVQVPPLQLNKAAAANEAPEQVATLAKALAYRAAIECSTNPEYARNREYREAEIAVLGSRQQAVRPEIIVQGEESLAIQETELLCQIDLSLNSPNFESNIKTLFMGVQNKTPGKQVIEEACEGLRQQAIGLSPNMRQAVEGRITHIKGVLKKIEYGYYKETSRAQQIKDNLSAPPIEQQNMSPFIEITKNIGKMARLQQQRSKEAVPAEAAAVVVAPVEVERSVAKRVKTLLKEIDLLTMAEPEQFEENIKTLFMGVQGKKSGKQVIEERCKNLREQAKGLSENMQVNVEVSIEHIKSVLAKVEQDYYANTPRAQRAKDSFFTPTIAPESMEIFTKLENNLREMAELRNTTLYAAEQMPYKKGDVEPSDLAEGVSLTVGSSYRKVGYEQQPGEPAVSLDGAAVSGSKVTGVSIAFADGTGGHSDPEQDKQIAALASNTARTAAQNLSEYFDKFDHPSQVPNDVSKDMLGIMQRTAASCPHNSEKTTLGFLRVIPTEQNELRVVGANVGDGMAFCYIPSEDRWQTIAPAQKLPMWGPVETYTFRTPELMDKDKDKCFVFDVKLPSDTIIFSGSDGIYDGLEQQGLVVTTERMLDDGTKIFESQLDTDKMKAKFSGRLQGKSANACSAVLLQENETGLNKKFNQDREAGKDIGKNPAKDLKDAAEDIAYLYAEYPKYRKVIDGIMNITPDELLIDEKGKVSKEKLAALLEQRIPAKMQEASIMKIPVKTVAAARAQAADQAARAQAGDDVTLVTLDFASFSKSKGKMQQHDAGQGKPASAEQPHQKSSHLDRVRNQRLLHEVDGLSK